MTYIEKMAKILEDNQGEKEVIIDMDTVVGFMNEMRAGFRAGQELAEQRTAIGNGSLHPRTIDTLSSFWRDVVQPPNLKSISRGTLESLYRDALARTRAMVPNTMTLPQDSVLEMAMLSLLMQIKDFLR